MRTFTDAEVRDIRVEYDAGNGSITSLAQLHGSSRAAIHKIIRGVTYKDVDPPRCYQLRPRGRARGPRPELRKLSLLEEAEIRGRGESNRALSRVFGVSVETIRQIKKR